MCPISSTTRLQSDCCNPTNCFEELANAIVLQACKDYRAALQGEFIGKASPKCAIRECEKFFKSEWFTILTKLNGTMLMNKLKDEVRNESQFNTTNP